MTKWNLKNRYVKFTKHEVVYGGFKHIFYDTESKDTFLQHIDGEYTVTDYDEPSAELLAKVEGKKFNTVAEAKAFIDGAYKPIEDRLNNIELALLESEGII